MESIVVNKIIETCSKVCFENVSLIKNNCHEISITAKLMCALSSKFTDWDVDIEYNRDVGDVKRLMCGALVRPDIIIHKRKRKGRENNLAIIEVKKNACARSATEDLKIICDFTTRGGQYCYQVGIFINILYNKIEYCVVKNGKIANKLCAHAFVVLK